MFVCVVGVYWQHVCVCFCACMCINCLLGLRCISLKTLKMPAHQQGSWASWCKLSKITATNIYNYKHTHTHTIGKSTNTHTAVYALSYTHTHTHAAVNWQPFPLACTDFQSNCSPTFCYLPQLTVMLVHLATPQTPPPPRTHTHTDTHKHTLASSA